MKRLTYITDQAWSASSAPAIHADRVCAGLTSLGWAVQLIQPASAAPPARTAYTCVPVRVPEFWRVATFQLAMALVLMRGFLRGRPDVMYVRQGTLLVVPAIFAAIFRVPMVLEVNGYLLRESEQRGQRLDRILLKTGVLRLAERLNVRRAGQLVVVAPGIREHLAAQYPRSRARINVVPNGVDRPAGAVAPAVEDHRFAVGYVGALEIWQGLDQVLEAAAIVAKHADNVTFMLVGDGQERDRLVARTRELNLGKVVTFTGAVPHSQLGSQLSQMDLCLNYPLRSRGGFASPMKIYEYLAAGKPVLSADVAGLREEFGESIGYVAAENPAALAAAITRLCEDPAALKHLRIAAEEASSSIRTWSDVAAEVAAICDRAAGRTARSGGAARS